MQIEISSPALVYKQKLFVPMFERSAQILQSFDPRTVVDVWYAESFWTVAYLFVQWEDMTLRNWRIVGELDESDSRNVLNNVLDVLAWDSR